MRREPDPPGAVLAEPADHPDSGPEAYPGRDDPDDSKGDGRDRNERAQLSSQAVARLVEALPLSRHLLANLIGPALSHFRAAS
jgi:hypothetical protein